MQKFQGFKIPEVQELKENSENQDTKKSTSTWAENKNFETNFLACEEMKLCRWCSMTEFLRL